MLNDIEEDPEWERYTQMNAKSVLQLLKDALEATAEELFPEGVPANNLMKGRHWNSKNRELKNLIRQLMRQLGTEKDNGAAAARLHKFEGKWFINKRKSSPEPRFVLNRDSRKAGGSVRE